MTLSEETRGRLGVLLAALLFSTGGAAVKSIDASAWQVSFWRCAIAAIVLTSLLPEARRRWTPRLIPAAAAYAATLLFFVMATKLTTSANAIFLQATAPIYLLLISPLFLRESIRGRDLALVAVIASGMALFFAAGDQRQQTAPDPALGNLYGAASGLFWALTVAALRKFRESNLAVVAMGNALGAALAFLMEPNVALTSAHDAWLLGYLGVFQIGLAYYFMSQGLRRIRAFEASALILLEPALNPVWTFLVHGEKPAPLAMAGAAVILAATVAQTYSSTRSS